ncbi:MAG: superoxide dismutase [Cu-Zn] SodC [Burkholderiaceae bacterium]
MLLERMKKRLPASLLSVAALAAGGAAAQTAETTQGATQGAEAIKMYRVDADGVGQELGQVSIVQTQYGVVLTPSLNGLPPGLHGFHLHENGSCGPKEQNGKMVAALAAGGHYDPKASRQHGAPWGEGHMGDLPALYVDPHGKAEQPVLAPRLKTSDLPHHALMVHAGGDNHADQPAPLGGGGARIACGVMK